MKKVKKDKKKKEPRRRKWPVWLTIILTILGIGVVSGITVLGVYLAGGFEENVINPEGGISFEQDDEYLSLYNDSLGQLEVTDDFTLRIVAVEQYITANEVTLSFANHNSNPYLIGDELYIDDGVIRVPQTVVIGEEFTVSLIRQNYLIDSEGNPINESWIVGGISKLRATSEYNLINPIFLQIAVDVPVYSIELDAVNANGERLEQILAGDSFYLSANFIPSQSQYIYSDDENSAISAEAKRTKHVYYQPISTLNVSYESLYSARFTVGSEMSGNLSLVGYVFDNAKDQIENEEAFLSETDITNEIFYNQMLNILIDSGSVNAESAQYQIEIGEAIVENFSILNQDFTMYPNKTFTIYANRYIYERNSSYLGVHITSTSGPELYSLIRNVGIAFSYQGSDPTIGDNAFLQVSGGDYVEVNGTRYYRPNVKVADYNNSFWSLRSTRTAQITMSVVLLEEGESGWEIFNEENCVYSASLSISQIPDEDVEWSDDSTIEVMLGYDENGNIDPDTIENLDNLVQLPEANVFRDYQFFVWFGEGDKAEVSTEVNKVIGANGYNYDLSGTYATSSDNLLLFALQGNTITLQDTGTFRIYFATVVENNGAPVYDEDAYGNRTYSIVRMSTNYITVVCEKALYQDSVSGNGINADRFTALESGEIAINQGTNQTLDVSFRINAESASVFTDEYSNGFISLEMRDLQNNDVTTYFNIVGQPTFTTDDESGDTILNYELAINPGVNISAVNGIYISQAVLVYDNGEDEPIEWYNSATEEISVYSPQAVSLVVNTEGNYQFSDFINGNQVINVNQSLTPQGSFDTSIDVGGRPFTSVTDLLTSLLGANNNLVTVTDQKGRTDTLSESWQFVVVDGDATALNLNGQTFTFRQADGASVTLALVSLDGNASSQDNSQIIRMAISSEGITFAEEASTTDPYTGAEEYQEANISNLLVNKYGAQSAQGITLQQLVKFYIGGDNVTGEEYNNLRFQLSQQYLNDSTITDEMMVSLYGTDGMISLYDEDGDLIEGLDGTGADIRQALSGQILSRIVINKDFALDHIIRFSITDTGPNGAINSTLSLTLMASVTLSRENYPTDGTPIYATQNITLANTLTNYYLESINNTNYDKSFASLYDNNTYYIIGSGTSYTLSRTDTANSVGTFSQGVVRFKDFWNVEYSDYTITFAPENNYFTLSQSISFHILRDLVIEKNNDAVYYILNEGISYSISDFVSTNRVSTGDPVSIIDDTAPVFEASYTFSNYFAVEGAQDSIVKTNDDPFLFGYNQTSLSTTLSIYYVQRNVNNEIINNILLGEIEIPIELNSSYRGNVYEHLAQDLFSYDANYEQRAQLQTIDDVDYLVVQQGTWFLNRVFANTNSVDFYIYANSRDGEQSFSYYYTTISGAEKTVGEGEDQVTLSGTTITFRNPNDNIFQGLSDRTLYLVLYFSSSSSSIEQPSFPGNTAVMYVPLIITSIGYNYVEYDNLANFGYGDSDTLALTMTDPNSLIEDGIYKGPYDTISAGQLTQILTQYDFASTEITQGGLYLLAGENLVADVAYYPLTTSSSLQTSQDIIKLINLGDNEGIIFGELTLNHLSVVYQNFYLALKYTISSTSESRDFYYVLKVVPDVVVNDPVYAYNGNTEYLTSTQGTNTVNLDSVFGGTTLNENKKRFNITKLITVTEQYNEELQANEVLSTIEFDAQTDMQIWLSVGNSSNYEAKLEEEFIEIDAGQSTLDLTDYLSNLTNNDIVSISIVTGQGSITYNGTKVFSSLKYVNEIESVYIGEDQYTSQSDWSRFITITFSDDYSLMQYSLASSVNEQVTINIRHRYLGGSVDDELGVVGGDQLYTIVVNTTSYNYSVRFANDDTTFTTDRENQTFVWEIDDSDITEVSEDGVNYNQASMNIHLLEGSQAGSSTGYTEVWNILQIQLTDETASEEFAESALFGNGFVYDSSRENNGKFDIRFNEYITSDREIEFTLYTQQGYLATLIVKVKATARVETLSTTLNGGSTTNLIGEGGLFNFSLGQTQLTEDNYTVSAVITSTDKDTNGFSGKDFVYFDASNGGSFVVANLNRNYNITCALTLTFDSDIDSSYNNKTFTFTVNLLLKANISYNNSVDGGVVIAGGSSEILDSAIFNTITLANTTITYEESSSGEAFRGIQVIDGKYNILTNYVSVSTPLDVRLSVRVYFNYNGQFNGNITSAPYQVFTINYSLDVEPSVKLEDNYPSPAGSQLTREYIDSGANFNNILQNFFLHTPIFSESDATTRIVMQSGEIVDGEVQYNDVLDYDDITSTFSGENGGSITVITTQNASVYSNDDGDDNPDLNENFPQSETIDYNENVIFEIGNWTTGEDGVKIVDNGSESYIILRFTYQNVSIDYQIYLLANSISVTTNYASKNVSSGNVGGEIVNYENIYIDQTKINELFSQSRMANVVYSSSLPSAGAYYLVFTDGTNFFASYPQYISQDDQGSTLTLDLGYSMASGGINYTYVGTYLAESFETNSLSVGEDGIINYVEGGESNPVTIQADLGTNLDTNNAIFQSVKLANRAQIVYGGTNGVEVDYTRYENVIDGFNLTGDIDVPTSTAFFTGALRKNDGSTGNKATVTLSTRYYYCPSIDIAVREEATTENGAVTLSVNRQYESVVEEFGIVHPSTGEYLSQSDFGHNNNLNIEIVDYTKGGAGSILEGEDDMISMLDGYLTTFNETKFKSMTDGSNGFVQRVYLYVSAKTSVGEYVYDYRMIAQGADNQGDLVLVKVTYEVGSYEKDFYVVVQILPDYQVSYGEMVMENDYTSDTISNISNIYNISETTPIDNVVYYDAFTLTSNTGVEGYVSVRHTNVGSGSSSSNTELATSNFAITLSYPGETIDGVQYNNQTNVSQKLLTDLSDRTNWTGRTGIYTLTAAGNTTFDRAKQVIFGTQYFVIDAVDAYGFKYQVYFSLQSSYTEPYIQASSISLIENSYFDITAQYDLLTLSSSGEDENIRYFINSVPTHPESQGTGVTLVEIGGIEAYLFQSDPKIIESSGIKERPGGGYTVDASSQPLWSSYQEDSQYFDIPLISNVTVAEISFYDIDTNQSVSEIINLEDDDFTIATTGDIGAVYNGYDNHRSPYTTDTGALKVPKITDTSIYGDSNTAQVQMVIKLKYQVGEDTDADKIVEYYDLSVRVNITRELSIMEDEAKEAVRDAQAFNVKDEFTITSNSANIENDATFINDTLEVLVNARSETSFTLRLYESEGGAQIGEDVIVSRSNTGRSVARTEYISISQQFGINVEAGNYLEVIPLDSNATFYYITNTGTTIKNNKLKGEGGFTISAITSDAIYVENSTLLESGYYYNVRKYYVVNIDFDDNPNTIFSYRVSKNYDVTGYFYTLNRARPGDTVMNTLNATKFGSTITSSFAQWNSSFTMTTANSQLVPVDSEVYKTSYLNYLTFTLDTISDPNASGNATITNRGVITYQSGFTIYDYINVVIRMRVSGADRQFNSDDDTYIVMDTLSLSWSRDYNL